MFKYSVSLMLWPHDANQKGEHPIYIRVTINRQTAYLAPGHHIDKRFWDEKKNLLKTSHPRHRIINADITTRKINIEQYIIQNSIQNIFLTSKQVKEHFSRKDPPKPEHNIFTFLESFIKEVEHKREGSTLENYRKHMLRLSLFHGSENLSFEEITPDYLLRYETHLRQEVNNNYITALFKTLKTIFNAAIKKGIITHYPFHQYECPIYEAPIKDYLTVDELKNWEEFAETTTTNTLQQTAIYFLLGCYSGLRISDWYLFDMAKNIKGNKIQLYAKKNAGFVSMIVSEPLKRNLQRMAAVKLTIEEPVLNRSLKIIAEKLGINKKITSHCARHTFAITVCAENGISSETCATLMGITVAVCVENYYRITSNKIDAETKNAWKNL